MLATLRQREQNCTDWAQGEGLLGKGGIIEPRELVLSMVGKAPIPIAGREIVMKNDWLLGYAIL